MFKKSTITHKFSTTKPDPLNEKQLKKIKDAWKKSTEDEKAFLRGILSECDDFMQIVHLFQGSHIMIQDEGELHEQMSKMKTRQDRTKASSHQSDTNQYSIQGKIIKEALCGTRTKESKNYTWVQLEAHPVNSLRNAVLHLLDYFMYKFTRKNIGPYGKSHYTEKNPLVLETLPKHYRTPKEKKERAKFWEEVLLVHPGPLSKKQEQELKETLHKTSSAKRKSINRNI